MENAEAISTKAALGVSPYSWLTRGLKRAFSFPAMLATLLATLSVLTLRSRFDDPDMWWHLKIGEIIWKTHTIPLTDLLSYTANHHAVVPQEWFSELTIFGAYKCWGYSGLMLWVCLLTAALLIAGYIYCSSYSGNAKVAFGGAMIVWWFATVGLAIRPQMIGYLCLMVELIVIQLGRTRDSRWFFALPILFAIWINCHASFVLGILVGGTFLFSSFFDFRSGLLEAARWVPRCRGMFALALGLSLPALFLNPTGIKQVLYPFDTVLNMQVLLANVAEWRAPQLTDERGIALMAVLLCSFMVVLTRQSKLYWDEMLLLTLATWLAVSHVRMMAFFGILVAPVLCRQLSTMWDGYEAAKDRIWPNAAMMGISAVVVVLSFPSGRYLEQQVENGSPVRAVQFIERRHLSGPMLNDYNFGGYLIWAAPEHPVFVDGRTDLYEWTGVLGEFGDWATLKSNPRMLLEKYEINFCILGSHSPMVQVMPLLREWKMVYSDDDAVIFVRNAPGNKGS